MKQNRCFMPFFYGYSCFLIICLNFRLSTILHSILPYTDWSFCKVEQYLACIGRFETRSRPCMEGRIM